MLADLAGSLRQSLGILSKQDVQIPARFLATPRAVGGPGGFGSAGGLGDDCAAIPDGAGYLLLAAEGIWPVFLEGDPHFAGYSAVMVNVSDIYAMGGRPLAVVDVVWGTSRAALEPVWEGMVAASLAYNVPIVGGHTSARSPFNALAVAIVGRATRLLTSFAARPGDVVIAAVDLRGAMHPQHAFWNASTGTEPARLRGDLEVLPELAEAGLCDAAKDISMGGIVGTLLMLLETSNAGAELVLDAIPRPPDVPLARWLLAFPSYGFVLSVRPEHVPAVQTAFARRDIACAAVGSIDGSRRLTLRAGNGERQELWDLAREPLTGFASTGAR